MTDDVKSLMNVFITFSALKIVNNNNVCDDEFDPFCVIIQYEAFLVRVTLLAFKSHCLHQQVNERLQDPILVMPLCG